MNKPTTLPPSRSQRRTARATAAVTALALPVVLASAALLGPHAAAADHSTAPDHQGLGLGGKLPHSIDLGELEARSLEHFAELDSNSNGLIDAQEYATGAKTRGHKRPAKGHRGRPHHGDHADRHDGERVDQAQKEALQAELFTRLDTDNNGELSSAEFADRREVHKALRKEQHLQRRFDRLDENGDAQISLTEFQQRLAKMRALDSNADGSVTRAELRRGIKERRSAERHLERHADSQSNRR